MMKRRPALALCFALVLSSMRCATIANGPMQQVHIESRPSNAEVRLIDCGRGSTRQATTPASVVVRRKATGCRIELHAAGFETRTLTLNRELARTAAGRPAIVGNWCATCDGLQLAIMTQIYLLLLVPSIAVDYTTGAMFEQNPSEARVDLKPGH